MNGGGVNLGIIVTPMLDMAFQLLGFFVMTYHPSSLEGSYKIEQVLPPEVRQGTFGAAEAKEPELPPKMEKTVLVVIKAPPADKLKNRKEGMIWRIHVHGTELGADENAGLIADTDSWVLGAKDDKDRVKEMEAWNDKCLELLAGELAKLRKKGLLSPDIKLAPDPQLKHAYLMGIMSACRLRGFSSISFVDPIAVRK
jgi:biopolymer transport protein ExbD